MLAAHSLTTITQPLTLLTRSALRPPAAGLTQKPTSHVPAPGTTDDVVYTATSKEVRVAADWNGPPLKEVIVLPPLGR